MPPRRGVLRSRNREIERRSEVFGVIAFAAGLIAVPVPKEYVWEQDKWWLP